MLTEAKKPANIFETCLRRARSVFLDQKISEFPDLVDPELLQEPVAIPDTEAQKQSLDRVPHFLHRLRVQVPRLTIGDVFRDRLFHGWNLDACDADLP